nr:MAG: hypothetical protein E4H34_01790 [Hyphomicrobiales bacterium]TFG54803.1 MAG: hypothetical protein E4H34_01805 [Hyphomicrobiales bacterium]
MAGRPSERYVAERLVTLYEAKFGGKERGRYRFSMKQMRALTGRKRVPGRALRKIGEEVFELGYVMIDLETYFVVLAQSTFRSYRRMSDSRLTALAVADGASPSNPLDSGRV